GLSAVVFGKLWRDAHLSPAEAAACTLLLGLAGGALNGLLITRLRMPPLIATLGSYSLFRGVAEALTGGVDNFTGFPAGFLYLGQGYIGGVVPVQMLVLVAVAIFFALLLHRSIIGRALAAIGYSEEGARYAGIPVARRITLVYILAGV